MANEYAVNAADLLEVAEAIREKGETEDTIIFPTGFVETIKAIKVSGVNAKAYEEEDALPTYAEEGNISIISTTDARDVYAQIAEPADPQNGDLWILFSADGTLPSVAGNITIYPTKAYQYISGVWTDVAMKVYKDGTWVDATADVIIYTPSDESEEITGGWYASSATGFVKDTQSMQFINGYVSTALKIDITHYSILKVEMRCSSSLVSYVGVGETPTEFAKYSATGTDETTYYTRVVDLEDLAGEYYVLIQSKSTSSVTYVSKVELLA